MLQLSPVLAGIRVDVPQPEQANELEVRAVDRNNTTGWELINKDGVVIRRFLATNSDKKIDRWIYFLDGREVYRDVDTNGDGFANMAIQRHHLKKHENGRLIVAVSSNPDATTGNISRLGKKKDAVGGKAGKAESKSALSGLVTFRGQPAAGRILVYTSDDQIFGCLIGDDGKYKIENAPRGNLRVTIEGINVPGRYSQPGNGLTVEIVGGSNVLDFELSAGG